MSKNPTIPMQLQLLKAQNDHPENEAFGRMLADDKWDARTIAAGGWLRSSAEPFLFFRSARTQYKVLNCPARMFQLAEIIGKSLGFNGKKSKPEKVSMAFAADIYRHADGFKLAIPASLQKPNATITLGAVTLTLHHDSRTITGRVPDSWLVDLNSDDAVTNDTKPCVSYQEFLSLRAA